MKQLTVFLILSALLLTGCNTQPPAPVESDTAAIVQNPEVALPGLTIHQGDASCDAHIGSYNWQIDNGNGTSTGICVDAVHPLDIADSLPTLKTDNPEVRLEFPEAPASTLIWCYGDPQEDAQLLSAEGDRLQLQPGSHVYLITASWPGSEDFTNIIHYSFRATVTTE